MSSQELKVWPEEQADEDELDDSFLNWILISCTQVVWTDMLSGWCTAQDRKALQRVIHPSTEHQWQWRGEVSAQSSKNTEKTKRTTSYRWRSFCPQAMRFLNILNKIDCFCFCLWCSVTSPEVVTLHINISVCACLSLNNLFYLSVCVIGCRLLPWSQEFKGWLLPVPGGSPLLSQTASMVDCVLDVCFE